MALSKLIRVRQHFNDSFINDVETAVRKELQGLGLKLEKGSRIAITAGSRGIDKIPLILRTTADFIKEAGAEPFFVPAMGSHGGATAEGQLQVLKELGITQEYLGAPILASMETVVVGAVNKGSLCGFQMPEDLPVHIDRYAWEADGIFVINRVKPHTSFHAEVESGLQKMIAIGLGKETQAANIHGFGTRGLRELIAPVSKQVISTGKIAACLGLVENAYDKLVCIKGMLPANTAEGEKELLALARRCMPALPVDRLDLLIVEQMGKNYSGTGMDTNIIGRLRIEGEPEPESPVIRRIAVLDLSDATAGNAYGIGLADFITRKLYEKIDYKATYTNMLATNFIERVKIPYVAEDEETAVTTALNTCGIDNPHEARIIKIKNTLELSDIQVSRSVYDDVKDRVEVFMQNP